MLPIAKNKKAYFNYEILEHFEAGVVLTGDEVKSVRQRQISLEEAFATIHDGEVFLLNCHIAPYSQAYIKMPDTRRSRKLLLKKKQIRSLIGDISRKGLTLVPLSVYINDRGRIKIEIGLAKHKKSPDKKRELRERDIKRETSRELKQRGS